MQSCKFGIIILFKFKTPLYYTQGLVDITLGHRSLELLLFFFLLLSDLHILLGSRALLMLSGIYLNYVKSNYELLFFRVDPTVLNFSQVHCWALVGQVDYEKRPIMLRPNFSMVEQVRYSTLFSHLPKCSALSYPL